MADAVRTFEKLVLEVADLRARLREKEAELDELRRALRSGAKPEGGQGTTLAIKQVVETVRVLGGPGRKPVNKEAVASKLSIKPQAALVRLGRAVKQGLLERPGKGQYRAPDMRVPVPDSV